MWILIFVIWALGTACAQEEGNQQTVPSDQSPDRPAEPAFEDTPTIENLPLSAIDEPALVPNVNTRSLLTPVFEVGEGVNSNVRGEPGTSTFRGITRALGSLTLQKERRRQSLGLFYVGGGSFSSSGTIGASQAHEFSVVDRLGWRSGQIAFRDSFSYLPEGSFGSGSFGGTGSLIGIGGGGTGLGGTSLLGSSQFGSLIYQPRITNVAMVDVTQAYTSRSSFTLAGSYGLVHFIEDAPISINSRQTSAQAGYNYQLTRTDQIGISYRFEDFRYPGPTNSTLRAHVLNLLYGHRISERLDFMIGGGPQATAIHDPLGGTDWKMSGSGRVSLRYRFPRTSLDLEYQRRNTSGSGVFAGAVSDIVRLSVRRPWGREWSSNMDTGYARNTRILPSATASNSREYSYWYAGGGLRRQLGRYFGIFASYQYNQQLLDRSVCGTSSTCNGTTRRHNAFVGLDWHPRSIRLD
jgi:hypothetical protein